MHGFELVTQTGLLILLLFKQLAVKLHFNAREGRRNHVRRHVGEPFLDFHDFLDGESGGRGLVVLLEVLNLLELMGVPLHSLLPSRPVFSPPFRVLPTGPFGHGGKLRPTALFNLAVCVSFKGLEAGIRGSI